jgi:hypothetical protein
LAYEGFQIRIFKALEDLVVCKLEGLHRRNLVGTLFLRIDIWIAGGHGYALALDIGECMQGLATDAAKVWNHVTVDKLLH